jgi:hypothetical protein
LRLSGGCAVVAAPVDLDPLLDRVGPARLVLVGEPATAPASSTAGGQSSRGAWWLRRILPRSRPGRLAGLPPSARQRRRRPRRGCGSAGGTGGFRPLAAVDVGQRGGRGVRALAARPQRRAAAAVPGRVHGLDVYSCSSRCARCWTSSPSTSRTIYPPRGRRSAASSPTARTHSPHAGKPASAARLRGGGRHNAARTPAARRRGVERRRSPGRAVHRRAERGGSRRRRALLPGDGPRRVRVLERPRLPHGRRPGPDPAPLRH